VPIIDDVLQRPLYRCNLDTYRRVRWAAWLFGLTGAIVALAAQIIQSTDLGAVGLILLFLPEQSELRS